jgi:2-iminobutanoate/2-iminopropanoate deaminase
MLKKVNTEKAPKAIGPYSQAVKVSNSNELLFVSGQLPIDPKTSKMVENNIVSQTEMCLKNIEEILKEENLNLNNIIKAEVYLSDMNNFSKFNETYERILNGHKPARVTVEVARLPKDSLIEISVIASE